ncbi:hypothetical protein CRV24_005287 [Beauveria bassiana]|nr:hypothetical protein CRV24_005287 [Beauveria bassiana]
MQTSIPASALKHLEPYPGGSWTVSGETADTVTVSYSCVDNPGVVSYTLHQCRTEQDVMARCQSHMYNFEPGNEKLGAENPAEETEKTSASAPSTIELKIEPVDETPWESVAIPTSTDCFNYYHAPANNVFSSPVQGNHYVQQSTSEYVFSTPPSFDCQQQISSTYNDAFVPSNTYWPMQHEYCNFTGEFNTNEYHTFGEQQWIQ